MKKLRADASVFLLVLMALVLIAGIITISFALKTDPIDDILSGDRIINTLISISSEDKPIVSTVLMYYNSTKRSALIDIPGETGLIIQSLGRVDRIDVLYDSSKPQRYMQEIGNLLGLEIPFFISLEKEDFMSFVDLVGGLDINVPEAISELHGESPVLIPSGSVVLDGEKAIQYLLYRNPDEDSGLYYDRQQRVVIAFIKKIVQVNDFLRSSKIWPVFRSLTRDNIKDKTLYRLIEELRSMDTDRILVQRIAGNQKEVSGQVLLFPFYDGNLIKDIVRQNLNSLTRAGEQGTMDRVHTVEVLNGTSSQGLARNTAILLQGFGYDTIVVANADNMDYEKTVVINRSGYEDAVKTFAAVIRCKNIQTEERPDREGIFLEGAADFTLIIGKDFDGRYVIQ